MGLPGGPPKALMLALKHAYSVERFLETGTFSGSTAAWAAAHFSEVITIEASPELCRAAAERHRELAQIRFVEGDSRAVLEGIVAGLGGPAIVWLDSHWSGGATYGEGDECPLLHEIATLRSAPHEHFIFVDDARLFLSPPPRPHDMRQWPTLAQVVAALTQGSRPLEVLVLDDAFIAVPAAAKQLVWEHAQEAATRTWDELQRPRLESPAQHSTAKRLSALARDLSKRLFNASAVGK
jgi:hypothetical protein